MKRKVVIVGSILLLIIIVTSSTSLSDNPSMPSELNVYVSDNTPNVGDTVKVTISEIPYEDRGEMQFSADVYYGDKEDYTSPWNEPDYILDHFGLTPTIQVDGYTISKRELHIQLRFHLFLKKMGRSQLILAAIDDTISLQKVLK